MAFCATKMCIKTIIFVAVFGLSYGQLQTRSYSCVIPSLCRDGSIIDPRILNPSGGGAASPNPLSGAGGGGGAMPSGGGGGAFPSGGGGGGAFPNGGGGGGGGGGAPPSGGGGSAPGAPTPSIGIITQGSDCSSGYIRCTLVTCGTPSTQPSTQDGIATQNAFPWQAFLINNNNVGVRNGYAGGGVLLDQYHVLTAAHKVTNLTSVSVSMGVYSTANSGNVQTVQVAQVWIHSNYDQTYLKNDVAVLRLATPFNINNNAMPICLPTSGRSYIGATSNQIISKEISHIRPQVIKRKQYSICLLISQRLLTTPSKNAKGGNEATNRPGKSRTKRITKEQIRKIMAVKRNTVDEIQNQQPNSSSCIVSGWGQTSFRVDDAPTQSLKQVHVPIVTNDACTNSYSNVLGASNAAAYLDFPNEICAGGQNQLDACTQDGGSPLVCSDTAPTFNLVGLVLWGKDCGQSGRYGVYLNVPSYVSWIQCTIQCIQGQTTCTLILVKINSKIKSLMVSFDGNPQSCCPFMIDVQDNWNMGADGSVMEEY
ncbi:hypothetical protein HUJ05_006229 [Dendroctonus ponderosae]|nr:hypothetical protein HUJ05_006229 [Dendroctonus ponderosae]